MAIFHIVVCGTCVPDPLQTLEPIMGSEGPSLKNEMMLPAVLDPWAAHALYEAANLAKQNPGSRVWLVSLGPKAKLQQLMMTMAQKVPFELVALEGSASGFADAFDVAETLATAIEKIQGLDPSRLLIFGGCSSASRDAGVTMQMIGERLKVRDQFLAVDELTVDADGTMKILERIEEGRYQSSRCVGTPAVLAWATGKLPIPPNNPQVGMTNMRSIMPAIQKAQATSIPTKSVSYISVEQPKQKRETKIVKDVSVDEMAQEIADWIRA